MTSDARLSARDVAAYLLDRADQYDPDSGCWVALADAAHDIMLGEVQAAKRNGDLDDALYERIDRMRDSASVRAVDPRLGVDE